ncbi:hypothetical protein TEA_027572 [Camellia sinensis var. sinensis]|uniref:Uncharacterized protein n=1 Tax=Camellia sinensis var. sinensis TaxID=542762 RepID=A0A4V6RYN2_CAMSN|nr:hypothetical protein TEA_027572 [Camellia sinensis var. sinensis]
MRAGSGVVAGCPRAAALPTLLFGRCRGATFRCYSSSSAGSTLHLPCVIYKRCSCNSTTGSFASSFENASGEPIISPGAKQGLIPLAIPLSKSNSGSVTALLRWPTAPPGMDIPVVEICKHGVWLLAKNVDQYIHRILVEEDAKNSKESDNVLFHAAADAGEKIYKKGDFVASQISNLDVYLLKKVPSRILLEVADIAQWEDEQIEYIKEKVSDEGRQEDLKKGKEPAQIALDEAAFLLDLASVEGTWDDFVERIAECYKDAGLYDISKFVLYKD